jgi:AcrR family transcriptional regulator
MTPAVQRRSKAHRDTGTRDRLVRAARTCLRLHGREGASSRAIADTAEANLSAITYYFGSKEDLLADALAEELAEWTDPALATLASPGDPTTRLLHAVSILDAAFEQARDRVPALLEVFVHAARDERADAPVARTWAALRARLSDVIAELRGAGVVPAWIDPPSMASLILAVVAGTVVATAVDAAGTDHRAIGAQFAALLLAARGAPD